MLELLVGSSLLALGLFAARKLRQTQTRTPKEAEAQVVPDAPFGIGDVLLVGTEEYWLAGEVRLDDGQFVFCLFPAPGAQRGESSRGPTTDLFVAQFDERGSDLAIVRHAENVPKGALPKEILRAGIRFVQRKAGRSKVILAGGHLPPGTGPVSYGVFRGPGMEALVVIDFDNGDRLALQGERLPLEMCERLPGEAAT